MSNNCNVSLKYFPACGYTAKRFILTPLSALKAFKTPYIIPKASIIKYQIYMSGIK